MALPDAIERVAFPDFVPPAPGAPDFHEGEFMAAAE
jgi:conjugal transfer ATP-binding protein TraC